MNHTYTVLYFCIALIFALNPQPALSQDSLSLEAIYGDESLTAKSVPGFNFRADGRHYTRLIGNRIVEYDITSGDSTGLLLDASEYMGVAGFPGQIDGYSFNSEENMLLLETQKMKIYRHSYSAFYYIFDLQSRKLQALYADARQREASFSPNGEMVAFIHENNLYYKQLSNGEIVEVTTDGAINRIINGHTDWVYEEEFAFTKAYEWAPDSKHLAYIRFDETEVQMFDIRYHMGRLYPYDYQFKYPKAGSTNSNVSVKIYDLEERHTVDASIPPGDIYVPRIRWTIDPDQLLIYVLNRHQNHLYLLLAKSSSGQTRILYQEKDPYYLDIELNDLTFARGGEAFIWTSEKDGYNHLYLMSMGGEELMQITKGQYDVSDYYGYDESGDAVYYQAAMESPNTRHIYRTSLKDGSTEKVSREEGTHEASFSSTHDYYIDTWSTINSPPVYTVRDSSGKLLRTLEDNMALRSLQTQLALSEANFYELNNGEGDKLNAFIIRPPDFDPSKKYPLLMYTYGGPGSTKMIDDWKGHYYWWFQYLAKKGYVVAAVAGRGTGGRGAEFKKITYKQLGHYETLDQIAAARHFAEMPFIDGDRIGIFGWSYGGYLSTLALLKGNDLFKLGIAVAPVTHWAWYDTIYTERYMQTPQENPEGYRNNSPVYFADRLRGHYLIAHGLADDNVHFQHTAEMVNALVRAGKDFDMIAYPNNAHGMGEPGARLHLFKKMTNFIQENL